MYVCLAQNLGVHCSNKSKKDKSRAKKAGARNTNKSGNNKTRKSKRAPAYGPLTREAMCVRELAKSVLDPFMQSACIPDGATGVGKFSTKATLTMQPAALGTCAIFALQPGEINNEYYLGNASTSTTPVVTGNYSASGQATNVTGLYQRLRPVSAGIRFSFTGSSMSDQGTLLLMQIPPGTSLTGFHGAAIETACSYASWYKVLPLRQGGKIIWRPSDVDDQAVFTTQSANLATSSTALTRPYMVGIVYGCAAASACVTVEYVQNWEGQYRQSGFAPGGIDTMSAPSPVVGWYERAHAIYNRFAPIVSLVAGYAMDASMHAPATKLISNRSGISVEEVD